MIYPLKQNELHDSCSGTIMLQTDFQIFELQGVSLNIFIPSTNRRFEYIYIYIYIRIISRGLDMKSFSWSKQFMWFSKRVCLRFFHFRVEIFTVWRLLQLDIHTVYFLTCSSGIKVFVLSQNNYRTMINQLILC